LQRSAQECGLDDRNLKTLQDITRPSLFPPFEWHSSGSSEVDADVKIRPTYNTYLIRKGRDITHRMQQSPCYLRPTQEVDVLRYRKKRQRRPCDMAVLEYLGHAASKEYIPDELLGKKPVARDMNNNDLLTTDNMSLEELAAMELLKSKEKEDGEEGEEEEDVDDDGLFEKEEEDEEAEDYVMNHYESEGDESDGGDDEPTF